MEISKLEPSKHKKGRFLVHLEDGTLLRVGESEVVRFGLYSGMELDDDTQAELESATQERALRERGIHIVTNRPHSRHELMEKLRREEATETEAMDVADYLERLGFLNDETFAHQVVQHYSAKGYGLYKVREELYRRGVPKDLWERALVEMTAPDDAIDAFVAKKLRGTTPDRKELKRVSDALARRGYGWQDIAAALDRYVPEEL